MVTPRCPYCNTQGLKHLAVYRTGAFAVVYCDQCGAIHGVVPIRSHPVEQKQHSLEPKPETPPDPAPGGPLADIGQADLTDKLPYSPEKMANRLKAAGLGRGTAYLQFAIDEGPPLCLQHRIEMEKITIPPGYKNAGKVFWVCPQYDECQEWELAEDEA